MPVCKSHSHFSTASFKVMRPIPISIMFVTVWSESFSASSLPDSSSNTSGRNGAHGVRCLSFNRKDFNNAQGFFYIREDILRPLLEKLKLRLIWAIWGERELCYKQMHRAAPDGDLAGYHHADFQAVYR